ncbi:hypothetical protein JOB18_013996 [Solea senegalensis]|uniref:Uncharacterized protein n=1 Tax=Solea senegalensis TaxID=28829 RepID=A0AAV6PTI6_SOLSE|nr:hypothetical protein JOB18_013996 [Solea senegalensis]
MSSVTIISQIKFGTLGSFKVAAIQTLHRRSRRSVRLAVERLITADIVDELHPPEMIPHEVYGAHFVSWSNTIFSGLRPDAFHK